MDKDVICSYENLYKAYRKAKTGKGFNGSCAKFQTMNLEGLHLLKRTTGKSDIPDESV